jgi:hypothetical protein
MNWHTQNYCFIDSREALFDGLNRSKLRPSALRKKSAVFEILRRIAPVFETHDVFNVVLKCRFNASKNESIMLKNIS